MSSDVRDVGEGGTDLIDAERVLGGHGVGRFTSREGSNDRGNVDARAGQTRLPKPYVGIHRNARKHFHTAKSNTRGVSETVAKIQQVGEQDRSSLGWSPAGTVVLGKYIGESMPVGSRGVARQAIFLVQTAQNRRHDHLRVFRKAMTGGHELIRVGQPMWNARS